MTIVLIFSVLFLLSFTIAELFNKKFIEGLPCAAGVIILILYAGGFVNKMVWSVRLLIILPIILLVYLVFKRRFRFNLSVSNISGMIVFFAVFIYFWYIGRSSLLYSYDEFSHWGLVTKNMYLYNNFGNIEPTTATFLTYPPGQALFQYFFLKLSRTYSESRMILASNVLIVSFILPVFYKCKNIFSILAGTIISLSALFYINNEVFRYTYVDMPLGVIWGFVIFTYFKEEKDLFKYITLSLSLAVLTLYKASGFGLAIGSLILFALCEFIANHKSIKSILPDLAKLLLSAGLMFAVKTSWALYISANNLSDDFSSSGFSLNSLCELFNGTAPAYRYETVNNFFDALINLKLFSLQLPVNCLMVIVLPVVILAVIWFIQRNSHKNCILGAAVTYLAVTTFFVAGLLFSYMFSFSPDEAVSLASFGRYVNTLAAGAVVILSFNICCFLQNINIRTALVTVAAVCFFVNPIAVADNAQLYKDSDIYATSFRTIFDLENAIIAKHCEHDSNLLYMAPGEQDLTRLYAQYVFTPVSIVRPFNFSPDGEKYYTESAQPAAYTVEELRLHLIENFDYVFIHKALPAFIDDYKELFNTDLIIEGLYKVDKSTGQLNVVELLQ